MQGLGMQKEANIKKDREKFAVALRKDRREEAMNKKRLKNVEKPAEDEKQTVDVSAFTIDDAFAYQNKQ